MSDERNLPEISPRQLPEFNPKQPSPFVERTTKMLAHVESKAHFLEMLERALRSVKKLADDRGKEGDDDLCEKYTLGEIAVKMAKVDFDRALEIAEKSHALEDLSLVNPGCYYYTHVFCPIIQEAVNQDRKQAIEILTRENYKIITELNDTVEGIKTSDDEKWESIDSRPYKDDWMKSYLLECESSLCELTHALARIDVQLSLKIAAEINNLKVRSVILHGITKALKEIDVNRALKIAALIEDPEQRDYALSALADGMIGVDLHKALDVALMIKDSEKRDRRLRDMVETSAKSNPERALEIANRIKTAWIKDSALREIVIESEKVVETLLDFGEKKLDDIFAYYPFETWKCPALEFLNKLSKLNRESAVELATRLIEMARGVRCMFSKAYVLSAIMGEVIKLDYGYAMKISELAMVAVEAAIKGECFEPWCVFCSDPTAKAYWASDIAECLVKVDMGMVIKLLDKLLEIARHEDLYAHMISTIAPELAKVDVEQAIELATVDVGSDHDVLSSQAAWHCKTNALRSIIADLARSELDKAVRVAERIKNPCEQANAFLEIAGVLWEKASDAFA